MALFSKLHVHVPDESEVVFLWVDYAGLEVWHEFDINMLTGKGWMIYLRFRHYTLFCMMSVLFSLLGTELSEYFVGLWAQIQLHLEPQPV